MDLLAIKGSSGRCGMLIKGHEMEKVIIRNPNPAENFDARQRRSSDLFPVEGPGSEIRRFGVGTDG